MHVRCQLRYVTQGPGPIRDCEPTSYQHTPSSLSHYPWKPSSQGDVGKCENKNIYLVPREEHDPISPSHTLTYPSVRLAAHPILTTTYDLTGSSLTSPRHPHSMALTLRCLPYST